MTGSAKAESYAAKQRRKYRHAEWSEQIRLTQLLTQYLADNVFWSALSNAPRSALAGYLAKKRGQKAGLADIMVVHEGRVTFVELKSPAGVASAAQRRVCAELRAAGANWYLARSAPAALEALRRANVPLRREWKSPPLPLWQGPFTNPDNRLPQAPEVAAERRAAQRRWRERQRARKAEKFARAPTSPHRRSWRERQRVHDATQGAGVTRCRRPVKARTPASCLS